MIEILEITDREAAQSLLKKEEISAENAKVLEMAEGDEGLGHIAIVMDSGTVRLLSMYAKGYDFESAPDPEQSFILDSLMRAGASYGETHGADKIAAEFEDFFGFFKNRGFNVESGFAQAPMSLIVKYSK